jgi:hypothetical protein
LNFGPKYRGAIPEDVEREFDGLGALIRQRGYPPMNAAWKEERSRKAKVDSTRGKTGG